MTSSWRSWRKRTAGRLLRDLRSGVGAARHGRVPTAPHRRPHRRPRGCQGGYCGSTRTCRRPASGRSSRALGASGYYRLHIGTWRVLYRPDGTTVTIHVLKVGRST
ncbi:type II toxin-antitoxin system RelE/ParE family toxin [Streptomyces sp. NPDC060223]|uniref:type II toxin-antitoxin system RelE/ParE family toxin n=1 Tax=unclassified Streptomyces TaxID=2593676 RepID=UPI0036334CE0